MPGGPLTPEKMPNPAFMNMMMMQSLANGFPFPPTPPMPDVLGATAGKMSEEEKLAAELGMSAPLTMNLAADLRLNDNDSNYQAAVRLRGLPFEASEQEILALFSAHNIADRVADTANAVQLLKKP